MRGIGDDFDAVYVMFVKKKREKKWDNGWKKVYGLVGQ